MKQGFFTSLDIIKMKQLTYCLFLKYLCFRKRPCHRYGNYHAKKIVSFRRETAAANWSALNEITIFCSMFVWKCDVTGIWSINKSIKNHDLESLSADL